MLQLIFGHVKLLYIGTGLNSIWLATTHSSP